MQLKVRGIPKNIDKLKTAEQLFTIDRYTVLDNWSNGNLP